MSLNNMQMLPARVRTMRQMDDLLNTEDAVISELESIIMDMYDKAALLHEELVNEAWLEEKLANLVGGLAYAKKIEHTLIIEIMLNVRKLSTLQEENVIKFLEKWLPAHLSYHVLYEKFLSTSYGFAAVWQDDEIMVIRQVVI